jgi:hypothetical protein
MGNYLKELNSIEKSLNSEGFKKELNELENYLDQFNCLNNSKIGFNNYIKENTMLKINLLINQKLASINFIL